MKLVRKNFRAKESIPYYEGYEYTGMDYCSELYRTEKGWLKRVSGINFDMETYEKFSMMYDYTVEPISITFNNHTLEYETLDYDNEAFIYLPQKDKYYMLSKLVSMFGDFVHFSEHLSNDKIFYHCDFKKDNFIFDGNELKIIDLDSFMWTSKENYHHYAHKAIKKLFGLSWKELFDVDFPTHLRETWYQVDGIR